MYVSVIFVIRCLYIAVSLTLVREQHFIRFFKSDLTLTPLRTACRITSTTVVVLPVPGGPWITATSCWASANFTASCCDASSPVLIQSHSAHKFGCMHICVITHNKIHHFLLRCIQSCVNPVALCTQIWMTENLHTVTHNKVHQIPALIQSHSAHKFGWMQACTWSVTPNFTN